MDAAPLSPVYDHFLSFVVEKATPREVLAFDIPADLRERAVDLLDKQDAGTLTPQEADELAQMQQVDRLVSALKARALAASKRQ
jgi:hypothetical protein